MDEQTRRKLQAVLRPQDLAAFAEIERAGREQPTPECGGSDLEHVSGCSLKVGE